MIDALPDKIVTVRPSPNGIPINSDLKCRWILADQIDALMLGIPQDAFGNR